MGKRDNDNRGRRPNRDQQDLTSRPFKDVLRGVKPWGTPCLKCGEPIDTRLGNGGSMTRGGAKRPVRNGWMHQDCEAELAKKYYEETWEAKEIKRGRKNTTVYLKTVKTNNALEVPVYLQTEIDTLMAGSEE